jgi:hypothetical protein
VVIEEKKKGKEQMKWSNIKATWALVVDGWSGLMKYVLGFVNAALQKLNGDKLKRASQIAVNVAAVVSAAVGVFVDEKYRDAANKTIDALKDLALSIEDGELSSAELNANIEAVNACVDAWKAVK